MSFVINKINHHKPQDYNTVKHSVKTTVMPTDVSVVWTTTLQKHKIMCTKSNVCRNRKINVSQF